MNVVYGMIALSYFIAISHQCDIPSLSECIAGSGLTNSSRICSLGWKKGEWSRGCDRCAICVGDVVCDMMDCVYGLPYWDDFLCPRRYDAVSCPCQERVTVKVCLKEWMDNLLSCADPGCMRKGSSGMLKCIE